MNKVNAPTVRECFCDSRCGCNRPNDLVCPNASHAMQAVEIGISNADFALEMRGTRHYKDSRGRCCAIKNHEENVFDTLADKGIVGQDARALAAYYTRIGECLTKEVA